MYDLHLIDRTSKWQVVFPRSSNLAMHPLGATISQRHAEHDILTLDYVGRVDVFDTILASGDPVQFSWATPQGQQDFYGYVHHVETINHLTSGTLTRVVCVAASYAFKESRQKIFKKVTADAVVSRIAQGAGFSVVSERHPRVFKIVAQTGQTDWQLLRRLALQTGYALRCEGTKLIFTSKEKIFSNRLPSAQRFRFQDSTAMSEAAFGEILEFEPLITDEAPDLHGARVNRKIGGILETQDQAFTATYPPPKALGAEGVEIQ